MYFYYGPICDWQQQLYNDNLLLFMSFLYVDSNLEMTVKEPTMQLAM